MRRLQRARVCPPCWQSIVAFMFGVLGVRRRRRCCRYRLPSGLAREDTRAGMQKWAREDLERYRNVTDEGHIKKLIAEGRRLQQELSNQVRMAK